MDDMALADMDAWRVRWQIVNFDNRVTECLIWNLAKLKNFILEIGNSKTKFKLDKI
jgi:hypothetical protein